MPDLMARGRVDEGKVVEQEAMLKTCDVGFMKVGDYIVVKAQLMRRLSFRVEVYIADNF
jgi:hypothetical protein